MVFNKVKFIFLFEIRKIGKLLRFKRIFYFGVCCRFRLNLSYFRGKFYIVGVYDACRVVYGLDWRLKVSVSLGRVLRVFYTRV